MTHDRFIAIVAPTVPHFDPDSIDRPLEETRLDSMDLLLIRSALEAEMGAAIADDEWLSSRSLGELLGRLP